MKMCFAPILLAICVSSAIIGLFLIFKPGVAIEIQKRFYAKINWRIEPISMPKEIRNTRIMGIFLVVLAIVTVIYILIK